MITSMFMFHGYNRKYAVGFREDELSEAEYNQALVFIGVMVSFEIFLFVCLEKFVNNMYDVSLSRLLYILMVQHPAFLIFTACDFYIFTNSVLLVQAGADLKAWT